MANTVFFAWQLDSPSAQNKAFIWKALAQAVGAQAPASTIEQSPRPEVDTQGVPGSPNIVETVFNRIRACSIFVADVSLVGTTASGKRTPNPNVMIELGYAARSVGWDRTVLVLNNASGGADDLPFDILQHRWPIEYRLTEQTEVRDKRYADLSSALEAAFADCRNHALSRAAEMAEALDTACLDFVAQNEGSELINIPLPGLQFGALIVGLDFNLSVRRLMELGALRVVSQPSVAYAWTHDGRRMIDHLNSTTPGLLQVLRQHRSSLPAT